MTVPSSSENTLHDAIRLQWKRDRALMLVHKCLLKRVTSHTLVAWTIYWNRRIGTIVVVFPRRIIFFFWITSGLVMWTLKISFYLRLAINLCGVSVRVLLTVSIITDIVSSLYRADEVIQEWSSVIEFPQLWRGRKLIGLPRNCQ